MTISNEDCGLPDHLRATTTNRGFRHLPPIQATYGGEVRAYESSVADGPHIWLTATAPANLNDPTGPTVDAPLLLTAESAWHLAEQLMTLARNHYQGDARPEHRAADFIR